MKARKFLYVVLLTTVTSWSACVNDDSTEVTNPLETIKIHQGSSGDEIPVFNLNLGDTCVIKPMIEYAGNRPLQYQWSVGTYQNKVRGKLEIVSTDAELSYPMLTGGAYYVHLTVTDGVVGTVQEYRVNINRTFEEGFVLVSNDEQGRGNLAFVKTMTPEEQAAGVEQVYIERVIERMTPGIQTSRLVGIVHSVVTFPETQHRILASTETHCYFFDPNTFTIISSIPYDNVIKGFKATSFYADTYSPFAYDKQTGQFVHLNLSYMFGLENSLYKNLVFDDCYACSYVQYGNTNFINMFVDLDNSEVKEQHPYTGEFTGTGNAMSGQKILSAFLSEQIGYNRNELVLTQSAVHTDTCYLHEFEGIPYLTPGQISKTVKFAVTPQTAIPLQGTRFVFSDKNNRYFYPLNGKVYVSLRSGGSILPKISESAIAFPEGEEITFMDVNVDKDELYVATYSRSLHRGSFYIYDCSDVKTDNQKDIKPKAAHRNIADKITGILYKSSL